MASQNTLQYRFYINALKKALFLLHCDRLCVMLLRRGATLPLLHDWQASWVKQGKEAETACLGRGRMSA